MTLRPPKTTNSRLCLLSAYKMVTMTPVFLLRCTASDSLRFLPRALLIGTMALIAGMISPIARAYKVAEGDGIGVAVYYTDGDVDVMW